MATSDAITQTVQTLEEALAECTNIADCLAEATAFQPTQGPQTPWVSLYLRAVHKLDAAAAQLIEDVNVRCIPLLKEMEGMTRSKS